MKTKTAPDPAPRPVVLDGNTGEILTDPEPDWEEIWSLYVAGASLTDLSNCYGVPASEIAHVARVEGWRVARAQYAAARA